MALMRLGPLVDDGASYSAIGIVELNILHSHIGNLWDVIVDTVPYKLKGFTHLQYGIGNHTSATRKILGSQIVGYYYHNILGQKQTSGYNTNCCRWMITFVCW